MRHIPIKVINAELVLVLLSCIFGFVRSCSSLVINGYLQIKKDDALSSAK